MRRHRPDKAKVENLVSRSRTAAMLGGVCLRTVKRQERPHGILTPHRIHSRLVCYPESEVLQLIANSRAACTVQTEAA